MQSQQKRVKWSRGETAEALEERTDTGITQASVELMENCIPDIYGNISRRPALKPIELSSYYSDGSTSPYFGFTYEKDLKVVPFYITEDDIVLIGVHSNPNFGTEFIRIKDNKVIARRVIVSTRCFCGMPEIDGSYTGKPISYAQQNNYMLIATVNNVCKIQITDIGDINFTPTIAAWKYSAGWYAPNGTQTSQITTAEVAGMNFDASSVGQYTYTESNGETTIYSWINTGLSSSQISATWTALTTTYYVQVGQTNYYIKTSLDSGSTLVGTFTMTQNATYTADQLIFSGNIGVLGNLYVYLRIHNNNAFFDIISPIPELDAGDYNVSENMSFSIPTIAEYIPIGCIVQFPNNGAYMRVEGYDSDGSYLRMYGSFLTPIADASAHDSVVKIETGYISLTPEKFSYAYVFPHPTKLLFMNQRLWTGDWRSSYETRYALVIGSQIARYTDLKNNYNEENEPITLDILTQFKENIVHLIDYNGLKIMTNSYEYAYEDGAIIKQSGNGSSEICTPIVFESLCLYVDSTGKQVKAMQYEFQSNIFNSSSINTLAPHDLVWNPYCMGAFEDKVNSTGKYLFLINEDTQNIPRIAVCNFVPGNQANIWNRWTTPKVLLNTLSGGNQVPIVHSVVHTKKEPIFMLSFYASEKTYGQNPYALVYPAILSFDHNVDLSCTPTTDKRFVAVRYVQNPGLPIEQDYFLTVPNSEIAIYSNGEFKKIGHVNENGFIVDDLTGLTNITVGLPINATIRSHPIDVGGKTKSVKKRIGKAQMSVHDTEPDAITINDKTGYMNPQKDHICFYGVTGMKDEIKYTLTNKNGAMFHLESLLMNIEYGTLDS